MERFDETIFNSLGSTQAEESEDVLVEELTDTGSHSNLVVHNDEENSFDWVIKTFMEILKHSSAQSEQLALIIHFKGRATVKTGPFDELRPLKDGLVDRGLSAVIEQEV